MKLEDPKITCKLGQGKECCAFLCAGPEGFECLGKEHTLIRRRLAEGTMNAKGIGNWDECAINVF